MTWSSSGAPVQIRIVPAPGAVVDLDYVEVFPARFGLVLSPGSGVVADGARLTFEVPHDRKVDKIVADGIDVTQRLNDLLAAGTATRTTTSFRTVIDVGVGDLLPVRGDVTELRVDAGAQAARLQLRTTPPACSYEGSGATRVLVTGFQPFPADAWHDNVSGVAVTALDVGAVHDAQVMKLILPVEYDRAAAEVGGSFAAVTSTVSVYSTALKASPSLTLKPTVAYGLPLSSPSGTNRSRPAVMSAAPISWFSVTATQLPDPVVSYSRLPSLSSVVILTAAIAVSSESA